MKRILTIVFFTLAITLQAQSPVATSPFEQFGDHIFIKLSVDGSEPLDFIFDTGDGLTVIDLDVAKKLNLPLDHKLTATSAQGSITGAYIKHNKIELGGMLLESNIKVYATSLKHLEISIGRNIDGIIGYDMLVHHVTRLNYDEMKVEMYDSGSYPKSGEKIPFKLYNAIPTITAFVTLNNDEELSGTFFLNTGAGTSVDFNSPYAKTNDIISKTGEHYSYLVKGLEETETRHYEGRVKSFRFGTSTYQNLPIGISEVASGIQGDKKAAGIIGNRILSKYNILFDYKSGFMYLAENSRMSLPVAVNCSGLDLQMNEDLTKVLVHKVFEGSAAEAAGIRLNDEVISLDGKPVSSMSLVALEEALKKEGATVSLEISSAGETRKVSLTLKPLL